MRETFLSSALRNSRETESTTSCRSIAGADRLPLLKLDLRHGAQLCVIAEDGGAA